MPRARNIKPGFFKNEELAECSPWARLCFAGLWTLADREGRLEDRAKRIKGELFAFDSIDVEPLLAELERFGFILRYAAEGLGLIQILAFDKHQTPHFREPRSTFPPPPSLGPGGDSNPPKPQAAQALNAVQTQVKPEALESKPDIERGSCHADTGYLIPDIPPTPKPRKRKASGNPAFERFYAAYPRKVAPDAARRAFERIAPDEPTVEAMLRAVKAQGLRERMLRGETQFVPHPASWLNAGRWKDAPDEGASAPAGEWWETRGGAEAKARELGLPPWDECCEFRLYVAKIRAALQRAA